MKGVSLQNQRVDQINTIINRVGALGLISVEQEKDMKFYTEQDLRCMVYFSF